jgi:acyl dehydratase
MTPSPRPRFLEDYNAATCYDCGQVVVTADDIVEFARQYDPQPMHVDVVAAQASPYGGLIASGWHTGALMMRLLVDHFLPASGSYGSPGVEQVRWPAPVRPDDTLHLEVIVLDARRSRSKPDRGIVRSQATMTNQRGDVVMEATAVTLVPAVLAHDAGGS